MSSNNWESEFKIHKKSKLGKELNFVNKFLLIIFIALFLISFVFLLVFMPKNIITLSIMAFIGIILGLLIFGFLHINYKKKIIKINPMFIVLSAYLIFIINILLEINSVYSLEWAFVSYIIIGLIFFDAKIDSSFLNFPALIIAGYLPFALISGEKAFAENLSSFLFYFLFSGLILRIFLRKSELSMHFLQVSEKIYEKFHFERAVIITGILGIILIIINRFINLGLWKWTSVYIFIIVLVLYIISIIRNRM